MEMPQSGERFGGREHMRAFQRARSDHSTPPRSLQLRRVLVKEGLWVVEVVIDYGGGQGFDVVLISELRDGKMWRGGGGGGGGDPGSGFLVFSGVWGDVGGL